MRARRTTVRRKLPPPEFVAWKAIMEGGCCLRWRCYVKFRRVVGKKPSWAHLVVRDDPTAEFGPRNARWRIAKFYRWTARSR
jgi:hypothetical protein